MKRELISEKSVSMQSLFIIRISEVKQSFYDVFTSLVTNFPSIHFVLLSAQKTPARWLDLGLAQQATFILHDEEKNALTLKRILACSSLRSIASFAGNLTIHHSEVVELLENQSPSLIKCLVPPMSSEITTFEDRSLISSGWSMSADLARSISSLLPDLLSWTLEDVINNSHRFREDVQWLVCTLDRRAPVSQKIVDGFLSSSSSVLCIIPHFACEEWLHQSISSIVSQTRQLQNIVVIHDSPNDLPEWILERFPTVTLFSTDGLCGPEQIVESVIRSTAYDAYMLQDADDWSCSRRLECLLFEATSSGAGLVGCQEIQISTEHGRVIQRNFPIDAGAVTIESPGHHLLHGSSLIARSLFVGLGGFDARFEFAGDTDLLWRACFLAKIVNSTEFCYFRRNRPNSRSTNPHIGLRSEKRKKERKLMLEQFELNKSVMGSAPAHQFAAKQKQPLIKTYYRGGPILRDIA